MKITKALKSCPLPLLAFLGTGLTLSAVFAAFRLFPFGPQTLSWGDMAQQVVPLLMELKDLLSGKADLFLNLQNAGGMNLWGVFFFFLSSPLHLLVVFVEKSQICLLVNLLVLLKLSLAAAAAALFFRREAPGLGIPAQLSLCLGYGLCGYGLLYYQNLVWLDVLALFPLVMLGFVRLAEGGGWGLFAAALAVTAAVSYYLSFMVFLGLVLFSGVFMALAVPKSRRRAFAGKLGLGACAALLLTAVVWLPSLLQCLSSARTGAGTAQLIRSGSFWAKLPTTLPVLLCTAGAWALPGLGFPRDGKSKAVALCWALTVLPLFVEPVNKLWHMGSYQAFPARYGYLPVFLGLWYLARALEKSKASPGAAGWSAKKHAFLFALALALPAAAGVWILARRFQEASAYTSTLWISPASFAALCPLWLACGGAVLALFRSPLGKRLTGWGLLMVCLVQGGVQSACFIGSAANSPAACAALVETPAPEAAGLYRVKPQEKFFPVNLLGAMGLPTLSHYTSLTDQRFLPAMKKLGYSAYWMEATGCGGTRLGDILLSNKYALSPSLDWLPTGGGDLGFLLPAGALPEELPLTNRFQLQNQLFSAVTGRAEGAFQEYQPETGAVPEKEGKVQLMPGKLRWEIAVAGPETLYFDAFDCVSTRLREEVNDSFRITVNGKELAGSYPTQRQNGILELGRFQNEAVVVEAEAFKEEALCSFGVWGLKDAAADQFAEALAQGSFSPHRFGLSGTARSDGSQALFLSVPWAEGMRVYVNGQEVQPRLVLDCFMEIPLPQGLNRVEVRCLPQGLLAGAALSLAAGMALGLGPVRKKLFPKEPQGLWYRAAPWLLQTALACALGLVYLLPPSVWLIGRLAQLL